MDLRSQIKMESHTAACQILDAAGLKPGQIFVVGCSTSEVLGSKIGTHSAPEIAEAIFDGIFEATRDRGIILAAQCCEHLNRALILESQAACKYGLEEVNVIPQPKAGGSFAAAAYRALSDPVAVEYIRAHAGMDIGHTLIGMHLREVAVPVRIEQKTIGQAHVVCARTRPKFIGGSRAVYDTEKI